MAKGQKRPATIDLTEEHDNVTHRPKAPRSTNSSFRSPNPPASQSVDAAESEDDENDAREVINFTQDAGNTGNETFELYGNLNTKIVGIRYYNGYATVGEHVVYRREPGNPYDRNAIRTDNVQGTQIGHIPRQVAAKLATYLDSGSLVMDAVLAGARGEFDCPLAVGLFGTSDPEARDALKNRMVGDRLPVDTLKKKEKEEKKKRAAELKTVANKGRNKKSEHTNAGPSNGLDPQEQAQSMDELIAGSEYFNPREVADSVEKLGTGEEALASMPMADQPARVSAQLLPYQRQGLAWLLEKENPVLPPENSDEVVQLWKRAPNKPRVFTNIATNFSIKDSQPKLASGAILADDMGLGKTLQVISLIVQDLEKYRPAAGNAATLIVSPLTVMSNWSGQIEQHVQGDKPLRVLTYHGASKKSMMDFDKYDVVITTYGTLATEYMPASKKKAGPVPNPVPRPSGLYSVNWRRVVLDEGHTIRNPNTKSALAATNLQARSRLVLTGTPLVNNLKDLYSLVRFIGLSGGLEKLEVFNSVLIRPTNSGDPDATVLLQALMSTLCLRRRKDMAFVDLRLPELNEYVHRIKFSKSEQEKYDALQSEAKGLLQTVHAQGESGGGDARRAQTYRHLLEILLRMRQVCNHWKLCRERVTGLMSLLDKQKTVDLTPENRAALQDMLRISVEAREECAICLEDLHAPVITHCGHVFGGDCISRVIETQHKCPMCRAPLEDETKLVEPAAAMGEGADDEDGADVKDEDEDTSTKVTALLSILGAAHKKAGTKVVVFSQWARFLDILAPHLADAGYTCARLDGSMSAPARDDALRALDRDPQTTILLATLGVCSVGLNLVAASQVVLCDSWWAPAIEDQAVDRVHRLGQTRACTVWRLVVEDSVEERTLAVQAEKRRMMMAAFREKKSKRAGGRQARLGDIERLLG